MSECVCVPVGICNCTNLYGVWACEPVCVCVCERVSEDSIWTVPSLPVGRGTTWLSVNHSLTSDFLGSHTHKETHTHIHTHKPRDTYTYTDIHPQSASYPYRLTVPHKRREEVRVTVRRVDEIVFSGCESESGIHSDFFKPMCHPAGKTTHSSSPISSHFKQRVFQLQLAMTSWIRRKENRIRL